MHSGAIQLFQLKALGSVSQSWPDIPTVYGHSNLGWRLTYYWQMQPLLTAKPTFEWQNWFSQEVNEGKAVNVIHIQSEVPLRVGSQIICQYTCEFVLHVCGHMGVFVCEWVQAHVPEFGTWVGATQANIHILIKYKIKWQTCTHNMCPPLKKY